MSTDTQNGETITIDEIPAEPAMTAKDHIDAVSSSITDPTPHGLVDRLLWAAGMSTLITGLAGWVLLKAYLLAVVVSPILGWAIVGVPLAFGVVAGISYVVQTRLQNKGVTLA